VTRRPASAFITALASAAPILAPATAQAHLVSTGVGPVYDGIAHLFVSIEDLLPVLAIGLLAGLNGAPAGRWLLFSLPLSWLAGGIAGVVLPATLPAFSPAMLSMLVLGILTATDFRLQPSTVGALAAGLGLVHGWQNGAALQAAGLGTTGLVGTAAAVFGVVTLVAASVVALRRPWVRIAVRAAGSWVAAVGLLMLGWTLSGKALA
jgi:hydrogenase/urease accessory protein HupE